MDYFNDILEIAFSVLNDKTEKKFKSSIFRLRDFSLNEKKDDLWTLNLQSLLNLQYNIISNFIVDPFINYDVNYYISFKNII